MSGGPKLGAFLCWSALPPGDRRSWFPKPKSNHRRCTSQARFRRRREAFADAASPTNNSNQILLAEALAQLRRNTALLWLVRSSLNSSLFLALLSQVN